MPRRRLQIHERWAGTAVLRRPSQLPRPTSAVAQARPSSLTWLPPRTAAAASFLVALRKKALKEQATARCPDILSLLTDETMSGSARSSSQSPPGTDADGLTSVADAGVRAWRSTRRRRRDMREVIFLLSISSFFHSSFFPQHSYASPLASTISSATCSPSALLLLPAVKNANLCIERTLQTQPLYTRALPGTSVAPILLPFPLLILSNHRRCVSSLFSSIGQLEFFLDLPGIFYLTTPK